MKLRLPRGNAAVCEARVPIAICAPLLATTDPSGVETHHQVASGTLRPDHRLPSDKPTDDLNRGACKDPL